MCFMDKQEFQIRKDNCTKWISFWDRLEETRQKSEDNFDKKIYAVCVGTIGLVMTFLNFFENKTAIGWIVAGVSGCTLALLLNLIVQLIAEQKQKKQQDLVEKYLKDSTQICDAYIDQRIAKDNKCLRIINYFSASFLILGIVSIFIFLIQNLN